MQTWKFLVSDASESAECKNPPRKKHKVEAIRSVPLSFVQSRSLLHELLQSPGVHLQTTDQVVHVRLCGLVMEVTASDQKCFISPYQLLLLLTALHLREYDRKTYFEENLLTWVFEVFGS